MLLLRRAKDTDLAAIARLIADDPVRQSYGVSPDAPVEAYRPSFEAIDADPSQFLAVAELGEQIVGTFQLTVIPNIAAEGWLHAQIESVFVEESARGKGIGRQMIAWAIDYCRERGCSVLQLTSNKSRLDAHRFYEHLGFARSHEGFKLYL